MENEDRLYCPLCGSSQLTANKQGFGAGKAITGAVLTGGVGLLAGFIGSGKIQVTCLKCNAQWKPGELKTQPLTEAEKQPYYNHLQRIEKQKQMEQKTAEEPISTLGCFALAISVILVIGTLLFTCTH